jgi:hypothetical protein
MSRRSRAAKGSQQTGSTPGCANRQTYVKPDNITPILLSVTRGGPLRHRGVLGVVAITLVILLAGCGSTIEPTDPSDVETDSTQSASAPPSPSPSPTATGTEDEEQGSTKQALDAADKAKAEGTISTFLQALDSAYKTGKTADARKLTHEKCGLCAQILGYIDDAYGDGGRIEGCRIGKPEGVTVGDLYVLPGEIRQVPYSAKVSVTECQIYGKSGGVVSREPAAVENMQFTLEQAGEEWKVRTWELQ